MELTYVLVVAFVTYVTGAITKAFIDEIPNRYIPLQNVLIGIISGVLCYIVGLETELLKSLILCLIATLGAGGTADFIKLIRKGK